MNDFSFPLENKVYHSIYQIITIIFFMDILDLKDRFKKVEKKDTDLRRYL